MHEDSYVNIPNERQSEKNSYEFLIKLALPCNWTCCYVLDWKYLNSKCLFKWGADIIAVLGRLETVWFNPDLSNRLVRSTRLPICTSHPKNKSS